MEIKTSKIKTVVSSRSHTGTNGTTIYHNLEMENGDKINIGKKKQQSVGWELTYEIIDEGQEYNKAKSAQKVETPVQNNGSGFPAPKNDYVQRLIVAQNCVTNAVNYHSIHNPVDDKDILKTAETFFNWVIGKGGENAGV